jgi:ABC-type glycerol-3-phosphate transport system substrate-binding protein
LATKGSLVAVDDVVGKDVDANYAPVWRQLGSVDGKLYGVWFKAADKSTTWYNTKVFKDAGIEPPKAFDDLVKDAKTISDSGVTPISQGAADGWTLTDWFENVYLRQAGADKYDQLSTHAIPWTDPSVKKALTTMSQVLAPNLLAGGAAGALQTDFPTSVTNVFASPPKAAIVYEGDFVATNIKKETQAKLGVDADFFDFPSVDGSQPAVVGGGDVAVLMKDSPGGRALMQYLASPDSAGIWTKLGGFTSPNKKVDLATYPDDITRRTAKAITSTSQFRFDMSDLAPAAFGGTVGKGEWKILQDWLAHQDQVDQTAQQLEDAAKAAFGH